MFPQWQPGIVREIISVGPGTRRFFISLPDTPLFRFRPGQFVTLDLPIHEQPANRWRSYSIASAPDGGNTIELAIQRMDGGAGTAYLFDRIREGDALRIRGPHGIFLMPQPLTEELFLICTGTGIAPFRSMIRQLAARSQGLPSIHLIAGCRRQADLIYHEELRELEQALPGFHYHPTLSRESWDGHCGRVHPVYEKLCQRRQPARFMLCGWQAMVDEAAARIGAMGYDKKQVQVEVYG